MEMERRGTGDGKEREKRWKGDGKAVGTQRWKNRALSGRGDGGVESGGAVASGSGGISGAGRPVLSGENARFRV